MKQKYLIISGLVIVLLLLAIWLYLMFFGTPKNPDDIFADLGFGGNENGIVVAPPEIKEETPVVNMARPRLRQLTIRPVIGFAEVQATTSDPIYIYYAEAGTGHVYQIELSSGTENRISNTTIAEASIAKFSPDGQAVAIRARNDRRANELNLVIIDTSTGSLQTSLLKEQVYDFTLISSSSLLYTIRTNEGLVARVRDWRQEKESALFTIPFYEAMIAWGETKDGAHIVYPKASHLLEGYLYSFTKGKMSRLPVSGFGLTAINSGDYITYTNTKEYVPTSYIYSASSSLVSQAPIIMLPEKCAGSKKDTSRIWCGADDTARDFAFPDNWYRGQVSFTDTLWQVNLAEPSADFLVDTLAESGRAIDVNSMIVGDSETALYFTNKNDNTLWMYEL